MLPSCIRTGLLNLLKPEATFQKLKLTEEYLLVTVTKIIIVVRNMLKLTRAGLVKFLRSRVKCNGGL
jgi:hypothetical protein